MTAQGADAMLNRNSAVLIDWSPGLRTAISDLKVGIAAGSAACLHHASYRCRMTV